MSAHPNIFPGLSPNHALSTKSLLFIACIVFASIGCSSQALHSEVEPPDKLRDMRAPDIHFVPTPQEVVDVMLEMADVQESDLLYDLGCGDGRIVVTAAKKFGCRGVGYDIDPDRIIDSRANVKENKVQRLVTIKQEDVFTLDLSDASVITLYLLPRLNVQLIPQLEKLKPGTRIVSHDFDMQGVVTPDESVRVLSDSGVSHTINLWITPLKINEGVEPEDWDY